MNNVLLPTVIILCSTLPPARQLLEDVRAQLPQDPVVIVGDLKVRKRKGVVTRALGVEMFLNLGSEPATARYTVRDTFGADLEQLTVIRRAGREPRFEYQAGSPLSASELPDLFGSIQGTGVSWADLTLSFLWWTGGTSVRAEEIRGQPCFVVDLPAPHPPDAESTARRYARVVLWIDAKLHMLLQAEAYDSDGKLVRRLWIKSFKKIDDRWMIKDMEVASFPFTHRTRLCVREVNVNTDYDTDSGH